MELGTPEPFANGRYVVTDALGEGGMATVYRAWDDTLHVHRAIKVLAPHLATKPVVRERFLSEARTMARLHHPNVVTVHDFGQEGDRCFIVMEWLSGGSVAGLLKRSGALPPADAIRLLLPVLSALGAAHSAGVVHRDVKPDNILLSSEGLPKLSDFGIAHVAQLDRSLTRTGMAMGTWAFMAPEQRTDAKRSDHRADIYAAGATLFQLVTGREPLDLYATNAHAQLFAGVDVRLAELIKRTTAYAPEDRPSSTQEMSAALTEVLGQLGKAGGVAVPVSAAPVHSAATFSSEASLFDDANPQAQGTLAPEAARSPGRGWAKWAAAGVVLLGLALVPLMAAGGWWVLQNDVTILPEVPVQSDPAATVEVVPAAAAPGLAVVPTTDDLTAAPAGANNPPSTSAGTSPALGAVATPGATPVASESAVPKKSTAVPSETAPVVAKGTPTASAVAATGKLFINTVPPGQVAIDGGAAVNTPVLGIELAAGSHKLTLIGPAGEQAKHSVQIISGESKRFCWEFAKGAECAR